MSKVEFDKASQDMLVQKTMQRLGYRYQAKNMHPYSFSQLASTDSYKNMYEQVALEHLSCQVHCRIGNDYY